MNVIITGFMGTGKTVVGRRLAKRLDWCFVDVDQLIEARAEMSIPRIFATRGEPVFRRLERRCIAQVVRGRRQVIATGGGAFVSPENQRLLRAAGPVICLSASPRVILSRVGRRVTSRPLLQGTAAPLARIQTLLARRAHAYAKADVVLDTSRLSVDEVVERLWGRLSSQLCRSWEYFQDHMDELAKQYGGKYLVVVDNRIVGSGQTQLEAYRNASQRLTEKREAGIYYIPLPEESLTAL